MLFVVIEMFVNVIMEKFEEQAELAHLPITANDISDFADVWSLFDPKAHGRIPVELITFIPSPEEPEMKYPGGEQMYPMGFLEELSERCPLLGANQQFEEELSEKVSQKPRLFVTKRQPLTAGAGAVGSWGPSRWRARRSRWGSGECGWASCALRPARRKGSIDT